MNETKRARVWLALAVERMAIVLRYLISAVLACLFVLDQLAFSLVTVTAVIACLLAHNVFAHFILIRKRYDLFFDWRNFVAYFTVATLIVVFTGVEQSDAYVVYFLVLIGVGSYTGHFTKTFRAAALCAAAYATVIIVGWPISAPSHLPLLILARCAVILICGWLVGSLSERLRRMEDEASGHAQALADSEATLRGILNGAGDPILVYDDNELITDLNQRATEFLGEPREKLLGKRVRAFLFDDGTWPSKMAIARGRGEYYGEQVFVNAEGDERTVELRMRSFALGPQRLFVAVAHDITEDKELREATQLANEQLERLNEELRQVNRLKSEFMSTMSARILSPLTAILGYIEMLLGDELGELEPDQRKALRGCRRSALRVVRMADDAFAFNRPQPPTSSAPAVSETRRDQTPSL